MHKTYKDNTKLRDISKIERIKLNKQCIDNGFMSFEMCLRVNSMCLENYESKLLARSRVNDLLLKVDDETGEVLKDERLSNKDIFINQPPWLSFPCDNWQEFQRLRDLKIKNAEDEKLLHIASALNKSKYEKKKRLKDFISALILKPCIFLTINFNDTYLNNTKKETRRQHIFRYLNSFGVPYCANIDFGSEKEREHYHAIIQLETIPTGKNCEWVQKNRGCIYAERVRSEKDFKKLAEYILKFVNHATKETTRGNSVIYSRNKN